MTETCRFPYAAASVTAARHFVADRLNGRSGEVFDTVVLIVSELATNAIRHAHTGFLLEVEVDETHIRIGVSDEGAGKPVPESPKLTDASGRGLRIVEHLADQWGVIPSASGTGKTVWFRLAFDGNDRALQQVP